MSSDLTPSERRASAKASRRQQAALRDQLRASTTAVFSDAPVVRKQLPTYQPPVLLNGLPWLATIPLAGTIADIAAWVDVALEKGLLSGGQIENTGAEIVIEFGGQLISFVPEAS